jgi:uncharacterized LabA/DUF88 family protein
MGDGLGKRNGPREGAVEPSVKPTAGYGLDASGSVTPRQLAVKRVAVFVDGFNLYHGMHEAFGRKYLWLDLQALSRSLLKPDQKLVAVHYFTARVRNDPQGAARQALYLGALKATGVRLVEGRFQEKPQECKRCGATWRSYEEKESDVNLCVGLMEAARLRQFDVALIVSGDSDMVPAVKAVRHLNTSLRLIAAFPPKRFSDDLRRSVHAHLRIGTAKIRQSQLNDVVSKDGRDYQRPGYWH